MRSSDLKVFLGAIAATAVLALAAQAQPTATPAAPAADAPASRCANVGAEPTLPDGARASDRAVIAADEAFMTWSNALRASAECRRAEFEEVANQRRGKAQAHDALNARLREVSGRWAEERNEYCARPRRQCRAISQEEMAAPTGPAPSGPCAETLSAPEPTIPEGSTANQQAMDAADTAYLTWAHEVQRNMQCRRGEFERLNAVANTREAEHNALAQRLAALSTAWETERNEYCARPRKQCTAPEQQQQ